MADFVGREKVLALQTDLHFDNIEQLKHWKCRHIDPTDVELLPAANVRPVVRGKWEVDGHHIRCSICGEYMCNKDREGAEIPRNFCPNCGASMEES